MTLKFIRNSNIIYNVLALNKKVLIKLILVIIIKLKITIMMFIAKSFREAIFTFVISWLSII